MADSKAQDLLEVSDPVFEIVVGGRVFRFDPFDVITKLEEKGISKDEMGEHTATMIQNVREVFGFPAPGQPATEDGKVPLNSHKTLYLLWKFFEFLKQLDVLKNLQSLTQT